MEVTAQRCTIVTYDPIGKCGIARHKSGGTSVFFHMNKGRSFKVIDGLPTLDIPDPKKREILIYEPSVGEDIVYSGLIPKPGKPRPEVGVWGHAAELDKLKQELKARKG